MFFLSFYGNTLKIHIYKMYDGFIQPCDMDKIIKTIVFVCSKKWNFHVFCSAHGLSVRYKCVVSVSDSHILFFNYAAGYKAFGVSETESVSI